MCNRYVSPEAGDMERHFHLGGRNPWRGGEVFPRGQGPFVRTARETPEAGRELVVGQWGLVPWFAKTPKITYSTNNARAEELAEKATFKQPWARGQRCIIPAWSFDEPNWESGKNVWWRFRRTDGQLWGLAGLWNTWTDKSTGEIVESYTSHAKRRRASIDAAHAQTRPEAGAGPTGQAVGGADRDGRTGHLAEWDGRRSLDVAPACASEHLRGRAGMTGT